MQLYTPLLNKSLLIKFFFFNYFKIYCFSLTKLELQGAMRRAPSWSNSDVISEKKPKKGTYLMYRFNSYRRGLYRDHFVGPTL